MLKENDMKKKLLSLTLCIAAVLSAGCGKQPDPTGNIPAPETTASIASDTKTEVSTAAETTAASTETASSTAETTTAASTVKKTKITTTKTKVTEAKTTAAAVHTEAATAKRTEPPTEAPTEIATEEPIEEVKLPDGVELEINDTAEIYSSISINSFLTKANVEILNGSDKVRTSKLGNSSVIIKYARDGKNYEQKLCYKVVDTTPPVILNAGWDACHLVGTAFDLNDYVGFGDNYDKHPTLTYTGKVNPNKTGDYTITAKAKDSSGNVTSWDVTISVVNSLPKPQDDRTRVKFSDFKKKYGGNGKRVGIDVSQWQGDIDWKAVKKAGCDFALIRMGYYYSEVTTDPYYFDNIKEARAAGVDVGVYFYTTDHTEKSVREHARWIAKNLGDSKLELPVAFDWEEFGCFQQYGISIHDLNELYIDFSDELSKYGYETMLYSSKNFLNNFWNGKIKRSSPVWLAHYIDETDYTGDYWIWQQSSCGKIPGIAGDVDMNVMYCK